MYYIGRICGLGFTQAREMCTASNTHIYIYIYLYIYIYIGEGVQVSGKYNVLSGG